MCWADAGKAVVSAGAGAVHSVTRYASSAYHHVTHVIRSAAHVVARAATATVTFVKHHAAAIASIAASVAVFAGCEAVLGAATGGVGAIAGATACGALAGAVGNTISYGITAAQTGHFSWSALGTTALEGAAIGAATGFAGGAAAEAGGLLARGAATAAEETGAAAAATGAEATTAAASSDAAASVAEDTGDADGGNWLGRLLAPRTTAYAHTAGDEAEFMNPVESGRLSSAEVTAPKTVGLLHVSGEDPIPLISGIKGPSLEVRGQGLPGFTGNQLTHVEGHAAAYMRINDIMSADLEINRVPCEVGSGGGCAGLLPSMLPEGAALRVYGPEGYFNTFVGKPDY